MPLTRTDRDGAILNDTGMIDRDMFAPVNVERAGIAAEIDGVAATALRLATNAAIAALIGLRLRRIQAETDEAAMAGTFQSHDLSFTKVDVGPAGRRGMSRGSLVELGAVAKPCATFAREKGL